MYLCNVCVNPTQKEGICNECVESMKIDNFQDAVNFAAESQMHLEFLKFIRSRIGKEVLYAYSGGQDSTAVLFLLKQICDEYKVKLNVFTIENGFKGKRTWMNIYNVIDFLGLRDNWKIYDIRNDIVTDEHIVNKFGENFTVEQIYALCFFENILPCGKVCNVMMDNQYKKVLNEFNEEYLITGGDTPKITNKKYSIFWKKQSGINIIRGGASFRINKQKGIDVITDNNIPWTNPGYGGYDTDCLVPGSILASVAHGNSVTTIEEIDDKFHVVLEYFKERVRMGIIDRSEAIKSLSSLDINDYSGYVEMKDTSANVLKKKKEIIRCIK